MLRTDWRGDRLQYGVFIVKHFTGYLMTLGVAKPPTPPTARELAHATLRRVYEDYLRRQRGLSERTIGHCWRFADRFLSFRFGEADVEFSAITPGDTVAFLQRLTTRKPPFRDKTPPTHLRSFFQYLFKSGLTVSSRTSWPQSGAGRLRTPKVAPPPDRANSRASSTSSVRSSGSCYDGTVRRTWHGVPSNNSRRG